jgi:phage nucleotide-binding protein
MVKKTTSPAVADIAKKIQKVTSMELIIAALFYGRSGSGKTTLAASFPGPKLLLDFREKGTDSVSDDEDLDVLPIETWEDVEPAYWHIKNSGKYKTIIIDQVSSMQDMCREFMMEKEEKEQMSLRLFGMVSGEMKTWLINYRDLIDDGINVIFLAHDRTRNVEEDDEEDQLDPNIGPQLMPSIAGTLMGAVKVIGNTYIRERFGARDPETKKRPRFVEYCLRVGPHSVYSTKLRTPKGNEVPSFIVNPDYEKILKLMKEGFKKPAAPVVKPTPVKRKVTSA